MPPTIIPSIFKSLDEIAGGLEDNLGDTIGYVEIWKINDLTRNWENYHIFKYISDYWFPFGSDGAGEMLCLNINSNDNKVYKMNWVGMSDRDAMDAGFTMEELILKIQNRLK